MCLFWRFYVCLRLNSSFRHSHFVTFILEHLFFMLQYFKLWPWNHVLYVLHLTVDVKVVINCSIFVKYIKKLWSCNTCYPLNFNYFCVLSRSTRSVDVNVIYFHLHHQSEICKNSTWLSKTLADIRISQILCGNSQIWLKFRWITKFPADNQNAEN